MLNRKLAIVVGVLLGGCIILLIVCFFWIIDFLSEIEEPNENLNEITIQYDSLYTQNSKNERFINDLLLMITSGEKCTEAICGECWDNAFYDGEAIHADNLEIPLYYMEAYTGFSAFAPQRKMKVYLTCPKGSKEYKLYYQPLEED